MSSRFPYSNRPPVKRWISHELSIFPMPVQRYFQLQILGNEGVVEILTAGDKVRVFAAASDEDILHNIFD